MIRVFSLYVALAGMALPAVSAVSAAEPPAAADFAVIEACLEKNQAAGPHRDGLCLELIASPCQALPGGETTLGMVMCVQRELAVWDSLLNRYYADMIRQLDDTARTALREAQRAWVPFRDKLCAFPPALYEGGSIGGPLRVQCLMEETARRASGLKVWLEEMDR